MIPNDDGTFTRQGLCNPDSCIGFAPMEIDQNGVRNAKYIETAPGSKTYYNQYNNNLMLYKADNGTWYGTITKSAI